MKHTSKFHDIPTEFPKECCVDMEKATNMHHELSYYLNGGIDLEGDALAQNGDAEYDKEEEADEIQAEGASAVALGDPRQSKFRLVEEFGAKKASKATASNPKPTTTTSTTEVGDE